jgi:hypothetical protein
MSRPPELFVRPLSMTEGQRSQRIGRTAKDPVKLRRAHRSMTGKFVLVSGRTRSGSA